MYIKLEDLMRAIAAPVWHHLTDKNGNTLTAIIAKLPKYDLKNTKKVKKEEK